MCGWTKYNDLYLYEYQYIDQYDRNTDQHDRNTDQYDKS
jgi:hypothetical protein